ncbi:MAG: phosphoenolpyruvate carboxykinase [Planctomycetota bacterium]|nr:phosphoenolpyruvate carboxykinase [Planctomycetota bacterium]
MITKSLDCDGVQIVLHTNGHICKSNLELVESSAFEQVVAWYIDSLTRHNSLLLESLGINSSKGEAISELVALLRALSGASLEQVVKVFPGACPVRKNTNRDKDIGDKSPLEAIQLHKETSEIISHIESEASNGLRNPGNLLLHQCLAAAERYLGRRKELLEFVEGLYNFWRGFDRFMVCHSEQGLDSYDQRPYRTFNNTVEHLTHLIRGTYRDICENITGDHPRVYRQVAAGCEVGLIVVSKPWPIPDEPSPPMDIGRLDKSYEILKEIPFIRQVWIDPPLIMDPPMNRRTGQFQRIMENPLTNMPLEERKWVCYPAQVGPLVIFVYFHQSFIGLGCALANLFELANDEQIATGPDAIYLYGVPPESLTKFGDLPTVFYDDDKYGLLVGAVPGENRFGYFGYLKKMVLTLHNIVMMKRGRMPYHGAMSRVVLKNGTSANILLIGDTATGKSESLEAFRLLGKAHIRELRIIADDMGSLEKRQDGKIVAYGTEIGAFIRLDDLQQGYAFGQIDRAIIMSPQKVNARVVLPITTLEEVLHGYEVNFLLYANNYEAVDNNHPVIERLDTVERALRVFREGTAMSKGTTTSTGLVHTYFANPFGPPQYHALHEEIANRTFETAFNSGVFVAQIRTRLGIPGYETKGPQEAARALFDLITTIQCVETASTPHYS